MTKKFRGGLFGFNRDDVMDFVVEAKEKENKLKSKCDALSTDITELTANNESLKQQLADAEKIIADFRQREEALTKLSESIGRLYLVAQANAEAVVSAAKDNVAQSESCVERNMNIATEAEAELEEIGRALNDKTQKYLDEIEQLKSKLNSARENIDRNRADIDESISEMSLIESSKNNENT